MKAEEATVEIRKEQLRSQDLSFLSQLCVGGGSQDRGGWEIFVKD